MKLRKILFSALLLSLCLCAYSQTVLNSSFVRGGGSDWRMKKADEVGATAREVSSTGFDSSSWMKAVVPGTVLYSLVENGVYPDPYYGTVNKRSEGLIPDLQDAGREAYTYWFRTEFDGRDAGDGERVFLQSEGINYRAEVWLNGVLVDVMAGMFLSDRIDITEVVNRNGSNALAVKVYPVDIPGGFMQKTWGAPGENHNGGDGLIGYNTTQLMTVGWDFTFDDGIRDRNTGIWRPIRIYSTGKVSLEDPFVVSSLSHPGYDRAEETISVDVVNNISASNGTIPCTVKGEITGPDGGNITFEKSLTLIRGERRTLSFTPGEFPQLRLDKPLLWWPRNKGEQNLYTLSLKVLLDDKESDSVPFGIREVTTTTDTPDHSKLFIVNGREIFVRGSNWIPEAMQRGDDSRMETELAYTAQSGINMLRLWGGGVAESDLFYDLCDKYGILVWQEFWMTGDTRHPADRAMYFNNMESTLKRIRNHPSLAIYVSSNESTETSGARELIASLGGPLPYQMQSETDGVHDGSPYKQVNPMCHYTNTASERGSRLDGFNPEYGSPTIPVIESLVRMMPREKLWPLDKPTWDYLDGNGFHLMSTLYKDLVDKYGESSSIEEFARKGQLLGAMNSKSIWETWNYNRLRDGDRFCSGLLFWYHNCPNVQVCARMWDWYLEPTASLFHTMHSLEPLHVQYDYLKNTVSVINDSFVSYSGLSVEARLYSLESKLLGSWKQSCDAPADKATDDILTISFPEGISKVHFISLALKDRTGKVLSENFYWRSTDTFEGPQTQTGPCTSGFESLEDMPSASLDSRARILPDGTVEVTLRNTSSRIAFFTRLQARSSSGEAINGTYYEDNFITILPREKKILHLRCPGDKIPESILVEGWNTAQKQIKATKR